MILLYKRISEHFHSSEFKCPHCNSIMIDEVLVNKLETLFSKLNASKCIISSGYRCKSYDVSENGFAGWHSKGKACDCVFYDKLGKIIPSKIVICTAWDLGIFKGIAKINNNYTHLDIRDSGTYYGDETRGNSSYWTNPYTYFKVKKSSDTSEYYIVKKGDTLWHLAQTYYGNGAKYHIIKELNNLSSNTIYIGQKLRIK